MTDPPTITRTWSVGSIVSATASIIAVLSVIVGITWVYARVAYATDVLCLFLARGFDARLSALEAVK